MSRNGQARPRKRGLSRKRVLANALRIADKQGVDALSMRKLAESLGVEAMSLYNHVQNKEDVLDGIVDLVIQEFEMPSQTKHWKIALQECVLSTYETLLKHPWAAPMLISRVSVGDGMLRYTDACIGCLHSAGFSYEMADHAWNSIHNHLYGFTLSQLSAPIDSADYAVVAKQYESRVPAEQYPHVHALMQLVIEGTHSGVNNIEYGLTLVLDGLERQLSSG